MAKRHAVPTKTLSVESVVAWRLAQQHLVEPFARDPVEVARDLVGVQAQVLSAAALSIALRTPPRTGGTIDDTAAALADRRLVRMWGHRGTLHLFAAEDVPTLVASSIPSEPWRRPAWLRFFRVTERQMERAIEAIGEILDDGVPRTRAELADAMRESHGDEFARLVGGSWGTFLKQAGDKGYVVHAWSGDSTVRFTRPDRWLGTWRVEDSAEAIRALVRRYLAAYGPASVDEVARWWGQRGGQMRPTMRELGAELTEVDVAGERGLVLTGTLPAIEGAALPTGDHGVRLLGPFDPMTVGAGLRNHLLPAAYLTRVSRTAGWISPIVLVDGRAAAVWNGQVRGSALAITIDPFERFSAARKRAVAHAAERVAAASGVTLTVDYGRVFDAPPRVVAGAAGSG
jgi:hypothetical protein